MICGFEWKTQEHICCCISEDEYEDDNPRHFCECGERIDCQHGEVSFERRVKVEIVGDDPECPF